MNQMCGSRITSETCRTGTLLDVTCSYCITWGSVPPRASPGLTELSAKRGTAGFTLQYWQPAGLHEKEDRLKKSF